MGVAERLAARVRNARRQALEELGKRYVAYIQSTLATPYPPESEPGERPHARSYDLHDSIEYRVDNAGYSIDDLVIRCTAKRAKAMTLEFGRDDGSVEARPFMGPARREMQKNQITDFANLVAKLTRK